MTRIRTAAALLATGALLAIAGCGGDDPERPAGATPTPTPDAPALAY
jgi:hypothetical protein